MIESASTSEPNPAPPDFLTVFESLPDAYLILLPNDPVFTIVAVTRAFEKIARTSGDQLLGRGLLEVFRESRNDNFRNNVLGSLQRVIALRVPETMPVISHHIPSSDGGWEERLWLPVHTPILDGSGTVTHIAVRAEDVTEAIRIERTASAQIQLTEQLRSDSQRSQAALRASERRFRQLAEVSTFGLVIGDLEGRVTYLNPVVERLLGYGKEDIDSGRIRWDLLTPPRFASLDQEALRQLQETGACQPYEKAYLTRDGREVPILVGASVLETIGGPPEVAAFILDLSARKQAEADSLKAAETLAQHWRLFDTALASTPDFTYIFDLEGRFTYVNRPLLALWQKSLDEALGKNFFELDYPPELATRLQRQIQQVIDTRARVRDETAYTGADGSEGYYEYIFVPVFAADGTVEAVAGSTRNITGRRAAETERERLMVKLAENNSDLTRANQDLTRANRELEEFAYVSSHDLKEPLRTINIYTQLLLKKHVPFDQPEARQYAEFVGKGVHRMEELIHDLLSYSHAVHSQSHPAGSANLSAAFSRALNTLQPLIRDSHASITSGDLPVVAGDEWQLAQVFENLIANALKYRKESEAPAIRITASRTENEWVIEVKDNGIGFEPQYAGHIFGLFKRLHREAYPGTGLGLAICRRIVERYGGRIWAESKLGQGARFYFALPEAAA